MNWRFLSPATFLSPTFSLFLLSAHATLLLVFLSTRWTQPSQRSLVKTLKLFFSPQQNPTLTSLISQNVNPEYILTTILTANSIGMLCARSLHYQFFAWTAWATPFLLFRSGMHPVLMYGVWAAQEWAWNVYPSTDLSSAVVVGALAVQVCGVWWGTRTTGKEMQEAGEVERRKLQ